MPLNVFTQVSETTTPLVDQPSGTIPRGHALLQSRAGQSRSAMRCDAIEQADEGASACPPSIRGEFPRHGPGVSGLAWETSRG